MSTATLEGQKQPFVFLHVGDQHLTVRDAQNFTDLQNIFELIARLQPNAVDFVYLPGDIAEDGNKEAYQSFEDIINVFRQNQPSIPILMIPGDHDRQYGTMVDFHNFYVSLMAERHHPKKNPLFQPPVDSKTGPVEKDVLQYYYEEDFGGIRCLFLDMVSAGYGQKGKGLDFRLSPFQSEWLSERVAKARDEGKICAVFMHTYPTDLEKKEAAEVAGLFWAEPVRLAEIGHTHYNELAHDGRTTYAAARSVGQNEDGSVGFAVGAIDEGEVSWCFRPLDRTAPFVLITHPVDRRLATRSLRLGADGRIQVRAVVLCDEPVSRCRCRVDDGPWREMTLEGAGRAYTASVPWPYGARRLEVEARDKRWPGYGPDFIDRDVIEPAGRIFLDPQRPAELGSDACSLGPWLEKGVRGDQLGPNRAGREW